MFNYYLEAFDKNEILTPSRLKIGLARLREFQEAPMSILATRMMYAIDVAKDVVRNKPKKAYFGNWHCIFGKRSCFRSLLEQYDESIAE